jgi:hypothetical protein
LILNINYKPIDGSNFIYVFYSAAKLVGF